MAETELEFSLVKSYPMERRYIITKQLKQSFLSFIFEGIFNPK